MTFLQTTRTAVLFGTIGILMAFLAQTFKGTVVQAALAFTGATTGPILGMFTLGAFFPRANWKVSVTSK